MAEPANRSDASLEYIADQPQDPVASEKPRPAATATAAAAAPAEHQPPVSPSGAGFHRFGAVRIAAAEAAADAAGSFMPQVISGASEVVERLAGAMAWAADASNAEALPAQLAYHFARVRATAFCDGLDRFINECASLVPTAAAPGLSSDRHGRAWAVTVAVVAADVLLGAHVHRRTRRRPAGDASVPEATAVPA